MPQFIDTNALPNPARRSAFLRDVTLAIRLAIPPFDLDDPAHRHLEWASALHDADMWCDPAFMQHYHSDDFADVTEQVRADLTTCISRFVRSTTPSLPSGHVDKNNRVLAATHLMTILDILKPILTRFWKELRKD